MKSLKSPTTVIAMLALFVALGGGAALASGVISGNSIANHSIPLRKLSARAVHRLRGHKGPKGNTGAAGQPGADGTDGTNGHGRHRRHRHLGRRERQFLHGGRI